MSQASTGRSNTISIAKHGAAMAQATQMNVEKLRSAAVESELARVQAELEARGAGGDIFSYSIPYLNDESLTTQLCLVYVFLIRATHLCLVYWIFETTHCGESVHPYFFHIFCVWSMKISLQDVILEWHLDITGELTLVRDLCWRIRKRRWFLHLSHVVPELVCCIYVHV